MSAPPLFRLADERRVTVVRDAAMVRRVLDEDPVGSCMVASRVADHGIDPTAIGGELWTRRRPSESLCLRGPESDSAARRVADLTAFADKAMSSARRCSSLVGRAELVLPMWRRLESAWGPARDVRAHQPLDGARHRAAVCDRRRGPAGPNGRDRCVPGGRDRHVHRRGRRRPPAG